MARHPSARAGRRRGTAGGGPQGPVPGTPADLTPDADPYSVARAIALRQLAMGPRTRAQLEAAMARKEVPQEVMHAVLDRFEEVNLVDDEEFSRQWVRSRHVGRRLAPRALTFELRARGVDEELVREAVAEITPQDELVAARDLVRRKLPATAGDDPARRTRRIASALARKGYGAGVAYQAIRDVLGEDLDGDPDGPADADAAPDVDGSDET